MAIFANQVSGYKLDAGDIVTALTSDVNLNTSEFSRCFEVTGSSTPTAVQLHVQGLSGAGGIVGALVVLMLGLVVVTGWVVFGRNAADFEK